MTKDGVGSAEISRIVQSKSTTYTHGRLNTKLERACRNVTRFISAPNRPMLSTTNQSRSNITSVRLNAAPPAVLRRNHLAQRDLLDASRIRSCGITSALWQTR